MLFSDEKIILVPDMTSLNIFIDVSGNYDFSIRGTRNIVLTCIRCTDIGPGILELLTLKHKIIARGIDIEYFHASEDKQPIRDEVFDIVSTLRNIRINSLVLEKRRLNPASSKLHSFYPMLVEQLLKCTFSQAEMDKQEHERVLIFADKESSRRNERETLVKSLKMSIGRILGNIPYFICMHSSASHPYLQIVDYCSWAIYVRNERLETRPYDKIKHLVTSENMF
jgi:hypothetical protein